MVIEIAQSSPWSTESVLFQCECVEELEAVHDMFVKGDETKWIRLRASKYLPLS